MVTESEVEHRIAVLIAGFLDSAAYDEEAAHEAVVPDLSAWLGALFDLRLEDEPSWPASWTFDDAAPSWTEHEDRSSVRLGGVAWLFSDTAEGERQPFSGEFTLAPSRDALAHYRLHIGDAKAGLAPQRDRARRRWPEVESWLFTFEGPIRRPPDQ